MSAIVPGSGTEVPSCQTMLSTDRYPSLGSKLTVTELTLVRSLKVKVWKDGSSVMTSLPTVMLSAVKLAAKNLTHLLGVLALKNLATLICRISESGRVTT